MDFNLLNPSFHNKTEAKPTFQLDKYNQHNPEPSDFEFSGGSPVSFTAAPPPFHNPYTQSPTNSSQTSFYDINPKISETFRLFLPNIENPNEISFQKLDSMEAMREMIFRMAMMQPVQIDPESVKLPKRKNVRISKDPQSVVARHRREKISQRIRILQRMVPGGTKLDTASMLDEAVHYLNFLKKQLEALEQGTYSNRPMGSGTFPMQIA